MVKNWKLWQAKKERNGAFKRNNVKKGKKEKKIAQAYLRNRFELSVKIDKCLFTDSVDIAVSGNKATRVDQDQTMTNTL